MLLSEMLLSKDGSEEVVNLKFFCPVYKERKQGRRVKGLDFGDSILFIGFDQKL